MQEHNMIYEQIKKDLANEQNRSIFLAELQKDVRSQSITKEASLFDHIELSDVPKPAEDAYNILPRFFTNYLCAIMLDKEHLGQGLDNNIGQLVEIAKFSHAIQNLWDKKSIFFISLPLHESFGLLNVFLDELSGSESDDPVIFNIRINLKIIYDKILSNLAMFRNSKLFRLSKENHDIIKKLLDDAKNHIGFLFYLMDSKIKAAGYKELEDKFLYYYGIFKLLTSTIQFFLSLSDTNSLGQTPIIPLSEVINDINIYRIMAITKISVLKKGLFNCIQKKSEQEAYMASTNDTTQPLEEYPENNLPDNFHEYINVPTIDMDSLNNLVREGLERDLSQN